MSVAKAEEYLLSCRSQGCLYQVICCESGPVAPRRLWSADYVAHWAYSRAFLALDQYKDALVGIGLQSARVTFRHEARIITTRMASLALVERDDISNPFLLSMSDDTPKVQAQLVALALTAWRKKVGTPLSVEPIANQVAKKVVGL